MDNFVQLRNIGREYKCDHFPFKDVEIVAYKTPSETTMNHTFHKDISHFTINLMEIHVQASECLSPVECNGNTKSFKI